MKSINQRFRPLSITDILDEAIELYKSNFVLLVGIAALIYVPLQIINGFFRDSGLITWIIVAITLIIGSIVTAALTLAVSERYLGREVTIKECYQRIGQPTVLKQLISAMLIKDVFILCPFAAVIPFVLKLGDTRHLASVNYKLLIVYTLSMLAIMLIAFAWLVYGGLRFVLTEPAVIIDKTGGMKALRRSWKLMSGSMGKGFLLYLIVIAVTTTLTGIIAGPTTVIISMATISKGAVSPFVLIMHTLLSTILNTLTAPFLSIVAILLYYDIRIRKEGFDLELLANELDQKAQETGVHAYSALPQEISSEQNQGSSDQA